MNTKSLETLTQKYCDSKTTSCSFFGNIILMLIISLNCFNETLLFHFFTKLRRLNPYIQTSKQESYK